MLVLARKVNQTLVIGDNITITILGIEPDQVKLGISAPPHVSIHRLEVYEAIKAANISASKAEVAMAEELGKWAKKGRNAIGGRLDKKDT
ncbi:MAG: carbon storage regulator CsrA [Clostridia bacterium]|nr:carbon storage regulator CsrA [Clostridia bacterium]